MDLHDSLLSPSLLLFIPSRLQYRKMCLKAEQRRLALNQCLEAQVSPVQRQACTSLGQVKS